MHQLAITGVGILDVFALLGVILAIPHLCRICDLIWLYFLRPSSVKRYLHGRAPYAIVTGATDGIGKATAAELLSRGFNVILHGRNETKMQKVMEELRASAKKNHANTGDVRYFIADASKGHHDWGKLLEPFRDLHVTVVVHNVGGEPLIDTRYASISIPTETPDPDNGAPTSHIDAIQSESTSAPKSTSWASCTPTRSSRSFSRAPSFPSSAARLDRGPSRSCSSVRSQALSVRRACPCMLRRRGSLRHSLVAWTTMNCSSARRPGCGSRT